MIKPLFSLFLCDFCDDFFSSREKTKILSYSLSFFYTLDLRDPRGVGGSRQQLEGGESAASDGLRQPQTALDGLRQP